MNNDPFFQEHKSVLAYGFVANTPELMFSVLQQLAERLAREGASAESQQLLARVWRPQNPLLEKISQL